MFADPPYNVAIDVGRIRYREFAMGCSEMSEVEFMTFLKTVFDRLAEHTIELQRVMDNPCRRSLIDWSKLSGHVLPNHPRR